MNFSVLFQSSLIPLLLITFFLSINFQLSVCADTAAYGNCSLPITCGSVKSNISYPFWGGNRPYYCGKSGFEVTCYGTVPLITMRDINFRILDMKNISSTTSPTVKVARDDYWETICPSTYVATNLNLSLFSYSSDSLNVSFWYSCNTSISALGNSRDCNNTVTVSYLTAAKANVITIDPVSSGACKAEVLVPVSPSSSVALDSEKIDIETAIDGGFELDVLNADPALCSSCLASGGACGANSTGANEFMCFCQTTSSLTQICTQSSSTVGSPGPKFNWKLKIVLGVCSVVGSILFVVTGFGVIRSVSVYKEANSEDVEAFIQNIGPLAVKRYKFSDVRKMTNSFKDKLGHGGYGDVYEGKLLNGCPVAVKVLKESKGNGEDFVNEVASISRTSHVNVVTLLGYCFEGKKKALIYEFMPNGSLEKFIYKDTDPLKTTPHMELEKLLQIAIGIARGLEYLHRGCNTRILHFDIKPHNILLDENFCPKISDFGLSKLCTRKESIISMLDARGTIGYIAPEVFCRNFGGVSVKSDVYSYGMMILEMVGGRKNIDARVSHTSEIYFPDWVYENLEQGSNFGLVNAVTEEEKEIARKMILVGLWCIQTRPSDRPSMSKVIEMLEGSIEALQTPPKPVLSSPVRSSTPKSTTLSTIS